MSGPAYADGYVGTGLGPVSADGYLTPDGFPEVYADGFILTQSQIGAGFPNRLDVYDNLNGSMTLRWGAMYNATSYNLYLNGALNLTGIYGLTATVTGLTVESYSSSAVAASTGNSLRPQNMPPNGVVTPSGTYSFHVCAVNSGGTEIARTIKKTVTVSPTSIMLTTPMKRLWPFPNTGLD